MIPENNVLLALYDGYQETGHIHPFTPELGMQYRKKGRAGILWALRFTYHRDWNELIPVIAKLTSEATELLQKPKNLTREQYKQLVYLDAQILEYISSNNIDKMFEVVANLIQVVELAKTQGEQECEYPYSDED